MEQTPNAPTEVKKPRSTATKFFFLHDKKNFPVACVASVFDPNEEHIVFAVATHNPMDTYDKKRAKAIAEARLKTEKVGVIQHLDQVKNVKWSIMYDIVMKRFSGKPKLDHTGQLTGYTAEYLPQRARESAQLWLEKFQKRAQEEVAKASAEHTQAV